MPSAFRQGTIFPPTPDFDGDGTGDILWPLGEQTDGPRDFRRRMARCSGRIRPPLMDQVARRPLDRPGLRQTRRRLGSRPSSVVPEVIDVDRDGTQDVIATFVLDETREEARCGGLLEKPAALGLSRHNRCAATSSRRSPAGPASGCGRTRSTRHSEWPGTDASGSPAQVVHGRGRPLLAVLDGDCAGRHSTSRPAGRKARRSRLPFVPVRPLQYADLDGDGDPEFTCAGPAPEQAAYQSLAAIATRTGRALWLETVREALHKTRWRSRLPIGPSSPISTATARNEVVGPRLRPAAASRSLPGRAAHRWCDRSDPVVAPIRLETKRSSGLDHVLDAHPISTATVSRDLVVVSRFDGRNPTPASRSRPAEPERLYVDALSGRDGHPLWWWQLELTWSWGRLTRIWKPRFWGRGPDGWPLLAIGIGGRPARHTADDVSPSRIHPAVVHVLELSTGRELPHDPGARQSSVGRPRWRRLGGSLGRGRR